ncbi:DUF3035 domain-containing protein [uncultured Sphingomonas sp.]|uniref:DUF3035 domain-containing protein n=1 Tax=uncultured Sphingomonas sp. TaxID=158754 RepID=UPI0025FA934A|nr:DUF3035 domain-containing protein [uncultured Sphingomonas sp.]
MRKLVLVALTALALAGCGRSGFDRARPDEFATARQAPLVIPPDFALTPPQPGAARPQDTSPSQQALDALFGGTAPRSPGETSALTAAGREIADNGIRASVGDPKTVVVDKGSITRDIVAAPEGDGQTARVAAGGQ